MSVAASRALGVDVGGTKILGVIIDPSGSVVAECRVPTPTAASHERGANVADAIAEVISTLLSSTGGPDAGQWTVGVGIPGMVGRDGILVFAPNLRAADGANFTELLSARLSGARAVIENDANCAALGEHHFGAARAATHALLVTLGTGIGGAMLVDGRLIRGHGGYGAEFGHMMVDPHGPPCPCGAVGCWERYASGAGLSWLALQAKDRGAFFVDGPIDGPHVFSLVRDGNDQAIRVLEDYCWWLGRGLANLCAAFDPELIMLGGGVSTNGDLVIERTKAYLATMLEGGPARVPPALVLTALGERSGAIGAALCGERGSRS